MKIFALEGSKGTYDEYISWIEGVFSSQETLEEYKDKYLENNKRLKLLPCPIDKELYDQGDWYDSISGEDFEKVIDWESTINRVDSFNGFNILELELDRAFAAE